MINFKTGDRLTFMHNAYGNIEEGVVTSHIINGDTIDCILTMDNGQQKKISELLIENYRIYEPDKIGDAINLLLNLDLCEMFDCERCEDCEFKNLCSLTHKLCTHPKIASELVDFLKAKLEM